MEYAVNSCAVYLILVFLKSLSLMPVTGATSEPEDLM